MFSAAHDDVKFGAFDALPGGIFVGESKLSVQNLFCRPAYVVGGTSEEYALLLSGYNVTVDGDQCNKGRRLLGPLKTTLQLKRTDSQSATTLLVAFVEQRGGEPEIESFLKLAIAISCY